MRTPHLLLGAALSVSPACNPETPLTEKERDFLEMVHEETKLTIADWQASALDLSDIDIPVQSMGKVGEMLNQEEVERRLNLLPQVTATVDFDTNVFTVEECEEDWEGACVPHFDFAQNHKKSSDSEIIEDSENNPTWWVKNELASIMKMHENPEPIETSIGTTYSAEFDQRMTFCTMVGSEAHENVHRADIGHNPESNTVKSDIAYSVYNQIFDLCMQPYFEEHESALE